MKWPPNKVFYPRARLFSSGTDNNDVAGDPQKRTSLLQHVVPPPKMECGVRRKIFRVPVVAVVKIAGLFTA